MFYSLGVLDYLVSMERNKMGVTQYCDGNADSASIRECQSISF